jgi:hypothetical protein
LEIAEEAAAAAALAAVAGAPAAVAAFLVSENRVALCGQGP